MDTDCTSPKCHLKMCECTLNSVTSSCMTTVPSTCRLYIYAMSCRNLMISANVHAALKSGTICQTYNFPLSPDCHGNRYQLMLRCWSSEPQARLNFTQLKYSFKSIIAAGNKDTSYITIQPDICSSVCSNLVSSRAQEWTRSPLWEEVMINTSINLSDCRGKII